MSRALMTLLGEPRNKLLEIAFDDLEKAIGNQAIDSKLVGDILHAAHGVIREIGLDGDVTAKELYQALRVHVDELDATTDYVGLVLGGQVVSMNRHDLADDQAAMRQFESRTTARLRTSLADEITRRYREWAAHPELLEPFIKYLPTSQKEKI